MNINNNYKNNQPAFGAYFSKSSIPVLNKLVIDVETQKEKKERDMLVDEFQALPSDELELQYTDGCGNKPIELQINNKSNGKNLEIKHKLWGKNGHYSLFTVQKVLDKIIKNSNDLFDLSHPCKPSKISNHKQDIIERLTTKN